jgi:hypothetical protein
MHSTEPSSAKVIEQLAKLIRLIFISDHPGEVSSAVDKVRRLLASEKLDAHWLADRLTAPPQKQANDQHDEKSTVWWCYHHRHLLSPRDRQFIEGLADWRGPLSPKQQNWLNDIVAKLERDEAA